MAATTVVNRAAREEPEARGLPWLTKYERTKIIGIRAEQLARGAQPFVQPAVLEGARFNACELAERELLARALPFVVVRRMPDGRAEHIRLDAPWLMVEGNGGAANAARF